MTAPTIPVVEPDFQPMLLSEQIVLDPKSQDQLRLQTILKTEITSVVGQIQNDELREIASSILGELVRFFDWLARIDSNLHKLDTLLESLSLLEILQFETRSLIDFIETRAIKSEAATEQLREVLDGINYGINHDVRRVYERDLLGSITEQSTPIVYGKILHAHGLLTNCFQQSIITLMQVFKPSIDGPTLFNDSEIRLEQSILLCKELSALMRLVKTAQVDLDPETLNTVAEKILEFRDGTMQYLMYRDWRGYENLGLEVTNAIENNLDPSDSLHRFYCYLEVLYGHVKMRAVLAESFPLSGEAEEN